MINEIAGRALAIRKRKVNDDHVWLEETRRGAAGGVDKTNYPQHIECSRARHVLYATLLYFMHVRTVVRFPEKTVSRQGLLPGLPFENICSFEHRIRIHAEYLFDTCSLYGIRQLVLQLSHLIANADCFSTYCQDFFYWAEGLGCSLRVG